MSHRLECRALQFDLKNDSTPLTPIEGAAELLKSDNSLELLVEEYRG